MSLPARPALAAVLSALRNTGEHRAFKEALVARDLWPAHDEPRIVFKPWELDGFPADTQRRACAALASLASCGLPALRTTEVLLREARRRMLSHGDPSRIVWTIRSLLREEIAPDHPATWRSALLALRAGATPRLPAGVDPSFLEPLRAVSALGFTVASLSDDRMVVAAPPLDAAILSALESERLAAMVLAGMEPAA